MKKNDTSHKTSQELLDKISSLESKSAEMEENWKRSLADYSNLEKRIESQKQLIASLASAAIVNKLIDVLDELYLAQNHLQDQGLQIAIDHFVNVLKSEGLEEITALNQQFDPQTMEAVDVAPGKEDQVLSVQRKGYLLNGQCLRPARVVVGRPQNQASASQ
jgi:molecular chaperone GrpE